MYFFAIEKCQKRRYDKRVKCNKQQTPYYAAPIMIIGLHKEKVNEKEANDQEYAVKDGHSKPIQIDSFLHNDVPFLGCYPHYSKESAESQASADSSLS
jgi:hypothetical protein